MQIGIVFGCFITIGDDILTTSTPSNDKYVLFSKRSFIIGDKSLSSWSVIWYFNKVVWSLSGLIRTPIKLREDIKRELW